MFLGRIASLLSDAAVWKLLDQNAVAGVAMKTVAPADRHSEDICLDM
jgi:hypothetical protein